MAEGGRFDQPERIPAGATGPGKLHEQPVLEVRVVLGGAAHPGDADLRGAGRPVDADVRRVHVRGRVFQERQYQTAAAVVHLDGVEPIAVTPPDLLAACSTHHREVAPADRVAGHRLAHPTGTGRFRVAGTPVAMTM
jgi:hypothetical protein